MEKIKSNKKKTATICAKPYHKLDMDKIDIAVQLVLLGRLLTPSYLAKLLDVTDENINQHVRRKIKKENG